MGLGFQLGDSARVTYHGSEPGCCGFLVTELVLTHGQQNFLGWVDLILGPCAVMEDRLGGNEAGYRVRRAERAKGISNWCGLACEESIGHLLIAPKSILRQFG